MVKLTVIEMILKIETEESFEAVVSDGSFTLKINNYVPYICAAIHDGSNFRESLKDKCLYTAYDRWYEEDLYTKRMISSMPIVIAGCDSRFEYDLNRPRKNSIYCDAWGDDLWKEPLDDKERQISYKKHDNFYKVMDALILKIEEKFNVCLVYDVHSFNWKRWTWDVPTFNIGAFNIDILKFGNDVEDWRKSLSGIMLPNKRKCMALINDIFRGNGYFLSHITTTYSNTLVLATEIKKIYCDELTHEEYPEIIEVLEAQLKIKIKEHAFGFCQRHRVLGYLLNT